MLLAPQPYPQPRALRALACLARDDQTLEGQLAPRLVASIVSMKSAGRLFRLTYVSRAAVGVVHEAASAAAILAIARKRNAAEGITGAMVHSAHWYGQVLEGARADIGRTFARIARDQRHSAIQVLRVEAIVERGFSAWAMAEAGTAPEALLARAATLQCSPSAATHDLQDAAAEIVAMLHWRLGGHAAPEPATTRQRRARRGEPPDANRAEFLRRAQAMQGEVQHTLH
jgi:hypothetical protein